MKAEMAERSEKIERWWLKEGLICWWLNPFLPSFVFFGYSRKKGEGCRVKEEGRMRRMRRKWPKEAKKIKGGGEKKDSSAGDLILFLPSFVFFGYSRVKGEGRRKTEDEMKQN